MASEQKEEAKPYKQIRDPALAAKAAHYPPFERAFIVNGEACRVLIRSQYLPESFDACGHKAALKVLFEFECPPQDIELIYAARISGAGGRSCVEKYYLKHPETRPKEREMKALRTPADAEPPFSGLRTRSHSSGDTPLISADQFSKCDAAHAVGELSLHVAKVQRPEDVPIPFDPVLLAAVLERLDGVNFSIYSSTAEAASHLALYPHEYMILRLHNLKNPDQAVDVPEPILPATPSADATSNSNPLASSATLTLLTNQLDVLQLALCRQNKQLTDLVAISKRVEEQHDVTIKQNDEAKALRERGLALDRRLFWAAAGIKGLWWVFCAWIVLRVAQTLIMAFGGDGERLFEMR